MENIHDEIERLLVLSGQRRVSRRNLPKSAAESVERLQLKLPGKAKDKSADKPSGERIPEKLRACQRALDTKELAEILNVSKLWILRKVKNRTIPHFKDGRILRFDPRLIADWWDKKSKY